MKRALVVVVLASLACAGATEKALELSTGGEFELSEERVVMDIDGQHVEVLSGSQALVPPDCPVPAWEGAALEQTMTVQAQGVVTASAVWTMTAPTDDVVAFYRAHLEAEGLTVVEDGEDMVAVSAIRLVALDDPMQRSVTITDGMGKKSVTASWVR